MFRLGLCLRCLLVCGAIGAGATKAAAPGENAAAIDFLVKRGLTRANYFWLSPTEAKLKGYLDGLKDLEKNLAAAEGAVVNGLKQNEALKAEIASLETTLNQINELLKSGKLAGDKAKKVQEQGQQIADRINKLRPLVVDPSGLDENQAVKNAIIRWVEARNVATLAVLFVRQNAATVGESYAKLSADKDVVDALAALGTKHKLGPAKKYDRDVKRIEKLEKLVLTDGVPVYRDNTMFRISAIINDQAAATFTFTDQANLTWIPSSVVAAAGIVIPEDAQKIVLTAEGDRKVDARQIKIPMLRFGKHVLKDVEVLVLAPEAEDMGAMLAPKSFVGFKPNLDVAKLEFSLTPLAGDAADSAGEPAPDAKPGKKPRNAAKPND